MLDSIFGYSFKSNEGIREPFASIITAVKQSGLPVISTDVPSGWNIDEGPSSEGFMNVDAVVSLTSPKKCMAAYKGVHYLGGRFMPDSLLDKYNCRCPIPYESSNQILRLN